MARKKQAVTLAWFPVPWPPAEDPRNDDKDAAEALAKFDASLAKPEPVPRRKKAGPRQRRIGG